MSILAFGLTGMTMLAKYNRSQMVSSFDTMYADRLIPASEIFHLSNLLYERSRMMENFRRNGDPGGVRLQLESNRHQMDSILHAYEQTYLVDEETRHIPVYKKSLAAYLDLENEIIHSGNQNYAELNNLLEKVYDELLVLGDIQLEVGRELARGHDSINGSMRLLDMLQTTLLLTLALLIIVLIHDYRSSVPRIPQGKPRLN